MQLNSALYKIRNSAIPRFTIGPLFCQTYQFIANHCIHHIVDKMVTKDLPEISQALPKYFIPIHHVTVQSVLRTKVCL